MEMRLLSLAPRLIECSRNKVRFGKSEVGAGCENLLCAPLRSIWMVKSISAEMSMPSRIAQQWIGTALVAGNNKKLPLLQDSALITSASDNSTLRSLSGGASLPLITYELAISQT